MRKILCMFLLVFSYFNGVWAQGLNHQNEPLLIPDINKEDSLYRDVVRKYTWYEGVGKITKEDADKLPYYFRLSSKNDAGHFQKVEALCKGKLTTNHELSTYILDKNNAGNNKWCDALKTVAYWILYSDISEKYIIEERAYNKQKDLVYIMQVMRNDNDTIHTTLTYLDSKGCPTEMNDTYTSGKVVCITYDKNGRDSIIDYLDGNGFRRADNKVEQKRFFYNEKDCIIKETLHNCVGDSIKDK